MAVTTVTSMPPEGQWVGTGHLKKRLPALLRATVKEPLSEGPDEIAGVTADEVHDAVAGVCGGADEVNNAVLTRAGGGGQ